MDTKTKRALKAHIASLRRRAESGDDDAIKSLACMILMAPDNGK